MATNVFLLVEVCSKGLVRCAASLVPALVGVVNALAVVFTKVSTVCRCSVGGVVTCSAYTRVKCVFFVVDVPRTCGNDVCRLLARKFFGTLLFLDTKLVVRSFFIRRSVEGCKGFLCQTPLFCVFFFVNDLTVVKVPPLSKCCSGSLVVLRDLRLGGVCCCVLLVVKSLLSSVCSVGVVCCSFFGSRVGPLASFSALSACGFLFPFVLLVSNSVFLNCFLSGFLDSPRSVGLSLSCLICSASGLVCDLFKVLPLCVPFLILVFCVMFLSGGAVRLAGLGEV